MTTPRPHSEPATGPGARPEPVRRALRLQPAGDRRRPAGGAAAALRPGRAVEALSGSSAGDARPRPEPSADGPVPGPLPPPGSAPVSAPVSDRRAADDRPMSDGVSDRRAADVRWMSDGVSDRRAADVRPLSPPASDREVADVRPLPRSVSDREVADVRPLPRSVSDREAADVRPDDASLTDPSGHAPVPGTTRGEPMLSVTTERVWPATHYTDLVSSSPGAEPTEAEWAALLAKKRRIEEWERQIADEKTQFYGEVKEMLARLPAVGGRGVAAEKLGMKKETVRWIDQLDLASRIRRLGRRKDT